MINLKKFNSKKVGIYGLGLTGKSINEALDSSGAEIYLWDDSPNLRSQYSRSHQEVMDPIKWPWDKLDYFFPSPGLDLNNNKKTKNFNCKKTKLMSDISLFEEGRGIIFPSGKMIAVTGTNGKSSTVTLLYEILKNEGFDVRLAGNIGIPILSLKPGTENTIYIIEVSSFQLELTKNIKPEIAILLNISEDHLDRHITIEKYRNIKSQIFCNQDSNDYSIICNTDKHTETVSKNKFLSKKIVLNESVNFLDERYYSKNLNAVWETLKILNISNSSILNGFNSFKGLKHRMELIYDTGTIRFINDSKATNASATNMAFDLNKNIFWIGGGDDKGNDLSKINLDSDNLKQVFLIGSAAVKLLSLTPDVKKPLIFKSLILAVQAAYRAAKKAGGGSIVLSPGCSSHDQFDSYEERGDIFSKTVLSLIEMKN